jgi:hypothetical protein
MPATRSVRRTVQTVARGAHFHRPRHVSPAGSSRRADGGLYRGETFPLMQDVSPAVVRLRGERTGTDTGQSYRASWTRFRRTDCLPNGEVACAHWSIELELSSNAAPVERILFEVSAPSRTVANPPIYRAKLGPNFQTRYSRGSKSGKSQRCGQQKRKAKGLKPFHTRKVAGSIPAGTTRC